MKNRHRVSQVVSKLILVTAAGARCFTVAANIANCRSYCASRISANRTGGAAGGEAARQEIAARSTRQAFNVIGYIRKANVTGGGTMTATVLLAWARSLAGRASHR